VLPWAGLFCMFWGFLWIFWCCISSCGEVENNFRTLCAASRWMVAMGFCPLVFRWRALTTGFPLVPQLAIPFFPSSLFFCSCVVWLLNFVFLLRN
jgi:hypothetical protein